MTRLRIAASLVVVAGLAAASHEDETRMARGHSVPLEEAMRTAVWAVPGRLYWAAREQFDGGTFVMVQVVKEDRSAKTVTLAAETGRVVKIEDTTLKAKPGEPPPAEEPYTATVPFEDALRTALKAKPGRLVEFYLYREAGRLLYGFETSAAVGKMVLVKVDALTGKVAGSAGM